MAKEPYIYVNAKFILNNFPEDYQGIIQDNYSFGKDPKLSLHEIVYGFIAELADFHEVTGLMSRGETVGELMTLLERLEDLAKKAARSAEE